MISPQVVDSALKFMTTGLETIQAQVTAASQERISRDSIAADARQRDEDRELARELYVRGRQDKVGDEMRALQRERERDRDRAEMRYYPFRGGPGTLRASISLTYPTSRTMPPLILLLAPEDKVDPEWRALPYAVDASLMPFQSKGLLLTRRTDRWTPWPDARLVENDLWDLPAIVVACEVVAGMLAVRLGGCNLGGEPVVRVWHQVAWLPLPSVAFWTSDRLQELENTSTNGFRRPSLIDTPEAQRALQLEWASRLAVLGIVAAVDAYHLLRDRGYEEQIDAAAAMLGPEFAVPLTLPMPHGSLADPAYHFLHQARRQLVRGDLSGAAENVKAAIILLGGGRDSDLPRAIVEAKLAGNLEEWHQRMLLAIAQSSPAGSVVPLTALDALLTPLPLNPEPTETTTTEPASRGLNGLSEDIKRIRPGKVTDPFDTW